MAFCGKVIAEPTRISEVVSRLLEGKSVSEQHARTKPQKMVNRNAAIILGVICIFLIAGIVETWLYYLGPDKEKDEMINTLNWLVTNQNNTISSLNSQVSSLDNEVASLQHQTNNTHIWGEENSTVLVNNETGIESSISPAYNLGNLSAAGYLSVLISSNNTSTKVGLYYTANSMDYAYETVLGLGGITVFPVPPSSTLATVIVGNSFGETSTFTVTITYYY